MQRIYQKIIRALFSACAVSMLLGACDSPTTPKNNPDSGQQGQQGQKGGSGSAGGGSVSGGGSYSHTKDPLTPEGKALHDDTVIKPDEKVTVTVTIKSVQDGLDGHAKVTKTAGGDLDPQNLTVTVQTAPTAPDFVKEALSLLTAEVEKVAGPAGVGAVYKFTSDATGATPVTAGDLTATGGTIHVSKFKEKVSVQVKTIDNSIQGYATVGSPYNAAKLVEGGAIPLNTTPTDYMAAVKKALADKVASTLDAGADPEGGAPYRIFKANNATTDITETDLGKDKTVYVAKKKKVQVKITLKLGGATTNKVTKDGHPLKDRTVIAPADNDQKGKAIYTAVGAGGQSKMSEAVYEITEEVFKGVADEIMKIITTAGGKLGTKAGEYALFTEQASDKDGKGYIAGLDYSALSSKDLTNLEIYIGFIES